MLGKHCNPRKSGSICWLKWRVIITWHFTWINPSAFLTVPLGDCCANVLQRPRHPQEYPVCITLLRAAALRFNVTFLMYSELLFLKEAFHFGNKGRTFWEMFLCRTTARSWQNGKGLAQKQVWHTKCKEILSLFRLGLIGINQHVLLNTQK